MGRFGQWCDAFLKNVTDADLRRGFAISLGNRADPGICQYLTGSKRRVYGYLNALSLAEIYHVGPRVADEKSNLVDHWLDRAVVEDHAQIGHIEIGHTDRLGAA